MCGSLTEVIDQGWEARWASQGLEARGWLSVRRRVLGQSAKESENSNWKLAIQVVPRRYLSRQEERIYLLNGLLE